MRKTREVTKGLDLSDRKAVKDYIENIPNEEKVRDMVENHILQNDTLLLGILDVTAAGWNSPCDCGGAFCKNLTRFDIIEELLGQYRKRNGKFINTVYAFCRKNGKKAA